ncbi:MAG: hypothetical protein AB8B96_05165 [Lysobacterales bacterium]
MTMPAGIYRAAWVMVRRIVLIVLAALPHQLALAQWTPHLTLASDSIHRGLSETSGKASLAMGIDWADEQWFAGARLGNSQLPTTVNPTLSKGQSLAVYGGFSWAMNHNWSARWLVSHYEFIGPEAYRAIDGYSELSLGLDGEHIGLELTLAPNAWGGAGLTRYAAINWQQPLSGDWAGITMDRIAVDVALGHADANASLTWDYYYAELGLSYSHKKWALDARVHALDDSRVNRLGWSEPRRRVALSLTYLW